MDVGRMMGMAILAMEIMEMEMEFGSSRGFVLMTDAVYVCVCELLCVLQRQRI